MRAYEVMIIVDPEADDAGVKQVLARTAELIAPEGKVATVDSWGRRRFTHPLSRKHEGIYLIVEIVTTAHNLDTFDRAMRLADDVIRHKIIRLPEREAAKRGLTDAAAG